MELFCGGKVRVRVFLKDLIVAIQYLTVRFAYTNQLSLSLRKQIRHSCGYHIMESKPLEMLSMKRDNFLIDGISHLQSAYNTILRPGGAGA